ncbi:30587_t:CDS:2 [Gigaspora margarita]|uniref:30587_t:CDS:1 n=1 Tax=Gigaspora margarita TaxID=4874 RepID=A0ABN7UZS2_GIGMA|nr:30587_t:CDS:2 [Gigaspora margarita]
MVKEKILIEEKLEDGKISSMEDGIKGDYFLLIKKRIIDNVDNSKVLSGENLEEAENKAALLYTECGCLDYRVEDTKEMISLFNKKEKFFKNKTDKSKKLVLEETLVLKANLNIEDKDKMVVDSSYNNIKLDLQMRLILWDLLASLRLAKIRRCFSHFGKIIATEWKDFDKTRAVFVKENQDLINLEGVEMNNNTGKKELDHLWDIIQNAIIKAANQILPKKKILNTGCSRKRSKVKTELEKSILVLGKIIRGIRDKIELLQLQSLNEGEQDLRGWKKILEKKCLTKNTISRNKEIQDKVKKRCEMIVNNQGQMLVSLLNKPYNKIIINKLVLEKQDHSRELITKPEEVMSITEKHFQNQYQKRNTRPNLLTQKWAEIYKPAIYVQEKSNFIISKQNYGREKKYFSTVFGGMAKPDKK